MVLDNDMSGHTKLLHSIKLPVLDCCSRSRVLLLSFDAVTRERSKDALEDEKFLLKQMSDVILSMFGC